MELGSGFPGYNTLIPKTNGTFAEVLRQNDYNTAWYGKHHNVADWHNSQAGPLDLRPTGLGFEYFYGFLRGDTSQWAPALYENIKPIEPAPGTALHSGPACGTATAIAYFHRRTLTALIY